MVGCSWNLVSQLLWQKYPANIYLFKVNNRNTTKRREICSELTIEILAVFIVNFEHISHFFWCFYCRLRSRKYLLANHFSHSKKRSSYIQLHTQWPKELLFDCKVGKCNFIRTDRSEITIWRSLFYFLHAFDFSLHSSAVVMV